MCLTLNKLPYLRVSAILPGHKVTSLLVPRTNWRMLGFIKSEVESASFFLPPSK